MYQHWLRLTTTLQKPFIVGLYFAYKCLEGSVKVELQILILNCDCLLSTQIQSPVKCLRSFETLKNLQCTKKFSFPTRGGDTRWTDVSFYHCGHSSTWERARERGKKGQRTMKTMHPVPQSHVLQSPVFSLATSAFGQVNVAYATTFDLHGETSVWGKG